MKIIVETKKNVYFTTVPTYFNRDNLRAIVDRVKAKANISSNITRYYVHSDYLTTYEKKQLDCHGAIISPMLFVDIDGKGLW